MSRRLGGSGKKLGWMRVLMEASRGRARTSFPRDLPGLLDPSQRARPEASLQGHTV